MSVGFNEIDTVFQDFNATGNTGDAVFADVDAPPDGVPFEASLRTGDSGGPLMGDFGNGRLTIIGVNWFVTGNDTTGDGQIDEFTGNGHTFVGNYDAELQAFIDANPVPEMRSFGMLMGLSAVFLIVTRRRIYSG
jgi:hypothetical protein